MKQLIYLLLLTNLLLRGSCQHTTKENITDSGLHTTQGTIINLTDQTVIIKFYHNCSSVTDSNSKRDLEMQHNPQTSITIPYNAKSIKITEQQSQNSSECSIVPHCSYSIQKSEVIMLVNDTIYKIVPDNRYTKTHQLKY